MSEHNNAAAPLGSTDRRSLQKSPSAKPPKAVALKEIKKLLSGTTGTVKVGKTPKSGGGKIGKVSNDG